MSDVFHEVDEEVRREQLQKLWERYQPLIVAAAILIVLGVAGWRGYEWWEGKKSAEAGSAFETAISLSEENKHAEAAQAFAAIAAGPSAGYRQLAKVRQAGELAITDPKAALTLYQQIAGDGSVETTLRDLAGLRAGGLMLDAKSFKEAQTELEPLTASERPFRHTARELAALAAWRAGDTAAATRMVDLIVTDPETPNDERGRIDMLRTLLGTEAKG